MAGIRSYRDLQVWQKGMDLAVEVYRLARLMPKNEEYRLTSQIVRAAASVPANIAEGNARGTRKDYANFISIARGSLAETETLLMLAVRTTLLAEAETVRALQMADELGRQLNTLRQRLKQSPDP
ncbi:MAG TPA: four helix bundle protein [Bauldia sp.]|nr:four helix bundle protein [Bauldia sp.]